MTSRWQDKSEDPWFFLGACTKLESQVAAGPLGSSPYSRKAPGDCRRDKAKASVATSSPDLPAPSLYLLVAQSPDRVALGRGQSLSSLYKEGPGWANPQGAPTTSAWPVPRGLVR